MLLDLLYVTLRVTATFGDPPSSPFELCLMMARGTDEEYLTICCYAILDELEDNPSAQIKLQISGNELRRPRFSRISFACVRGMPLLSVTVGRRYR